MVDPVSASRPLPLKRLRRAPTTRFGVIICAVAAPLIGAAFNRDLLYLAAAINIAALALAAFDYFWLSSAVKIEVRRLCGASQQAGRAFDVFVSIANLSAWPIKLEWLDGCPQRFSVYGNNGAEGSARIEAKSELKTNWKLISHERGDFAFGAFYVGTAGFFGLVKAALAFEEERAVRVYPASPVDLGRFGLARRLSGIAGKKPIRRVGSGGEFENLRPYQTGDDRRLIDWKATARIGGLIVRQQSFEKDQTVMICLDKGRQSLGEEGGVARFEKAIAAAVTLAHEGIKAGDRVGFALVGRGLERVVPPASGANQLKVIRDALFDVKPDDIDADFETAMSQLKRLLKRRALVVVISDAPDAPSGDNMSKGLRLLYGRHLVVAACLKDTEIASIVESEPRDDEERLRRVFAARQNRERALALGRLASEGASVLDVAASRLSIALLEKYLDAKTRGAL